MAPIPVASIGCRARLALLMAWYSWQDFVFWPFSSRPMELRQQTHLFYFNGHSQMVFVWLVLCQEAGSVPKSDIIFWVLHFQVFSCEVTIHSITSCVFPPIRGDIRYACFHWKDVTHSSLSSCQSGGRLTSGWGHAAQNKPISLGPGSLSVSCPNLKNIRF